MHSKVTFARLLEDISQSARKPGAGGMEAYLEASSKTSALDRDRNKLIEKGKEVVFEALKTGQVKAYAFEKPRKVQDDPIELEPSTLINNVYFRWDNGTVKYQGLEFTQIRMINEARVIALVAKWREEAGTGARMLSDTAVRGVGRPPVKPFIVKAFQALHAQGKIDYTKTLTSHYPLIRQWLAVHCSSVETSDHKPSGEVIRVAVGNLFKAEKKKSIKL